MSMQKESSDAEELAEELEADLEDSISAHQNLIEELSFLFGKDLVMQVEQIDIADINLNQDIIECISAGVKQLKALKHNPQAQVDYLASLNAGEQLVLCLWIKDMDLLEKIQDHPYTQ